MSAPYRGSAPDGYDFVLELLTEKRKRALAAIMGPVDRSRLARTEKDEVRREVQAALVDLCNFMRDVVSVERRTGMRSMAAVEVLARLHEQVAAMERVTERLQGAGR